MPVLVESIRSDYATCITTSCTDQKCSLKLDDIDRSSLAIIHGDKYTKQNGFNGKLCDRIIFCGAHSCVLLAVELKGGKNQDMSYAIEQIQNGLNIANDILSNQPIADWIPLLLYSGSMKMLEQKVLQNKRVAFKGMKKHVEKRDCGIRLSEVLQS